MLKRFTFVVSAQNHPDVLARIVTLLHRLAIPIEALTMKRPKGRGRMNVIIEVEPDSNRPERIAESLLKVVQVISVKTILPKAKTRRERVAGFRS